MWPRGGQVVGCYEHGNEPFDFIKCGEYVNWVRNCWLLKHSAVCNDLHLIQLLPLLLLIINVIFMLQVSCIHFPPSELSPKVKSF